MQTTQTLDCPYQSPIAIVRKCTIETKHSRPLPKELVKEYVFDLESQNWLIEGKDITLVHNCRTFYLQRYHLHIPGEHTVDKDSFAAEAHFVFLPLDEAIDAFVVGIPFQIGEASSWLNHVIQNQPFYLPFEHRESWGYTGSLTEPIDPPFNPTTPINWLLLSPQCISIEQLEVLAEVSKPDRSLQDLDGRNVLHYKEGFISLCC